MAHLGVVSVDFFTVPTVRFQVLYAEPLTVRLRNGQSGHSKPGFALHQCAARECIPPPAMHIFFELLALLTIQWAEIFGSSKDFFSPPDS